MQVIKRLVLIGFLAGAMLLFMMQSVSPAAAGPLGILFVLLLMYLIGFSVIAVVVLVLYALLQRLSPAYKRRTLQHKMKQSLYVASLLAVVPVTLIAMQSIGGIGVYEIFLVVVFASLSLLYVSKRKVK